MVAASRVATPARQAQPAPRARQTPTLLFHSGSAARHTNLAPHLILKHHASYGAATGACDPSADPGRVHLLPETSRPAGGLQMEGHSPCAEDACGNLCVQRRFRVRRPGNPGLRSPSRHRHTRHETPYHHWIYPEKGCSPPRRGRLAVAPGRRHHHRHRGCRIPHPSAGGSRSHTRRPGPRPCPSV